MLVRWFSASYSLFRYIFISSAFRMRFGCGRSFALTVIIAVFILCQTYLGADISYGDRISNASAIEIWSDLKHQFSLGAYSITFFSNSSVTKVRSIVLRRPLDL